MTTVSLTPAGEQVWLRLRKHIEWTDGFCVGFIFSEHSPLVNLFRDRLVDIFRLRVTRLQFVLPEKPEELTEHILRRIIHPFSHETAHSGPVWIDLSAHSREGWPEARLNFIARLNEHREPLRRNLGKPLVLIFPLAEKKPLRAMAPDLWAIRSFTIDTSAEMFTLAGETVPVERKIAPIAHEATAYEQTILAEWDRLYKKGDQSRGILWPGFRTIEVLQKMGKHATAKEIADYLLPIARKCAQKDPEALRDLSISLDNVGKTAQAMGQWDEARDAFNESLDIRRRIIKHIGETPEALRDLSISLDNVGKTAQAMGQWDEARDAFNESLDICRRIIKYIGETPEALRDLSISLDNVGNTAKAMGKWEGARDAFEEGLLIGKRLSENFPHLPGYAHLAGHFTQRLAELDSAIADAAAHHDNGFI